ncbi:hypothetical protein Tco_0933264 [Tanacetum coccineum]
MNLSILTNRFSHIPIGYLIDLSASWILILVGFSSKMPNFRKREYGMRLMLAPKSAKAFFTGIVPIRHGNVKLPGSLFFCGKFFWIADMNGRLIFICLKIDKNLSRSSSFFCFLSRDGKGTLDDLEGWWRVDDKGVFGFGVFGFSFLVSTYSSAVVSLVTMGAEFGWLGHEGHTQYGVPDSSCMARGGFLVNCFVIEVGEDLGEFLCISLEMSKCLGSTRYLVRLKPYFLGSSGRMIGFRKMDALGEECSRRLLIEEDILGFELTEDEASSSKRFCPAMAKDSFRC